MQIKNIDKNANIIVGLSGGVDSATTLLLLSKEFKNVKAVFMKNWDDHEEHGECTWKEDYDDAKKVAEQLNIELIFVSFEKEYFDLVFEHTLEEYKKGRTPNPDILCNKEIKFKTFLNYAINELNADYVATGHYASTKIINDEYVLVKAKDENKDQTYFLGQISKEILSKIIFPLGEYEKSEVRKIASDNKLFVANKKDSTGICFIGEQKKFNDFLDTFLNQKKGNIVCVEDGNVIGKHSGLFHHTIGQRKGLGIGGLKQYENSSWFVVGKDIKKNILYVSQNINSEHLTSNKLLAADFNKLFDFEINSKFYAKTRYRQEAHIGTIEMKNENEFYFTFDDPQIAITPGQAIVVYDDEKCICSGIIEEAYYNNNKLKYL